MRQQQAASSSWGSRTKRLWLTEGEIAKFWFLQEPTDFVVPLMHGVPVPRKGGGTWSKDVLCARRSLQDPVEKCELCVSQVPGPWPRSVTFVWVDQIAHPKPPSAGQDWKPIRRGGGGTTTYYAETVRDLRVFILKSRLADQLDMEYQGVADALEEDGGGSTGRHQTVLNRPFRLKRTGSGPQSVDVLESQDPVTVPAEVVAARRDLGDVDALIEAEFSDHATTGGGERPAAGGGERAGEDAFDGDDDLVSF